MGKKEVKFSLFTNNMIFYKANPNTYTHKQTDTHTPLWQKLITEFRKVAGYKNNIQKSTAFLYTRNEQFKSVIKETIPHINTIINNEILRNKFNENKSCTLKTT